MRRLLVLFFRWLAQALTRLYYPVRTVEGGERVPANRPVVFVLNHPNGLLDPLVLRVATGRPARFLAKSTLYGNAFGRLAMDAFDTLPVYRTHEAGARAGDVSRNDETFARCREALARGEALALFPEGTSHSDPQMKPLKTGAARIALSAEREAAQASPGGAPLGVVIVPVGLYYERKERFRSRVLLVVGETIEAKALLPRYLTDERATVDELTEDIRARLEAVVLQAETSELLAGIARVARWTADERERPTDAEASIAADVRRARELVAAYDRVRARDPARVAAISAEARAYARTLRYLGVRDPWALEVEPIAPARLIAAIGKALVAAPFALVGAVLGWLPYRLAGIVAGRVTDEEAVISTVKLIAGAVFMFVAWAAEAIVAGALWGGALVPAVFVACVFTGYVALRFEEVVTTTSLAVRTLWLRAFHFDVARQLGERRRALAESVERALREAA